MVPLLTNTIFIQLSTSTDPLVAGNGNIARKHPSVEVGEDNLVGEVIGERCEPERQESQTDRELLQSVECGHQQLCSALPCGGNLTRIRGDNFYGRSQSQES